MDASSQHVRSDDMRTGDPYKGMEVLIVRGDAKMHFGVVQGTRVKDGQVIVEVTTSTRQINTTISLNMDDVVERL